jgi:hypothetical protein
VAWYGENVRLAWLRGSAPALALAAAGWAGCATAPQPMVDPGYAARAYAPARIAVLPPDVFVVVDQVGDNDPAQSAALGQAVSAEAARAAEQALRGRGYDVDLSSRWDGIVAGDGSLLVTRDELGALANGVVSFANSRAGGGAGPMAGPLLVAPELAAKVGWATQSDALLYVNVKGAVTTPGKRAASIVAGVFIVFVVVAIVVALAASHQGGGNGIGSPNIGGGAHGGSVTRAASTGGGWRGGAPGISGGGWRGTPPGAGAVAVAPARVGAGAWRGSGRPVPAPIGAPVYRGGGVGIGVGVVIPLDGPVCTHEGGVDYDDPVFAGDELYVSMTLVSTYDGRVLWHARQEVDLEADQPADINAMVHAFLDALPPAR